MTQPRPPDPIPAPYPEPTAAPPAPAATTPRWAPTPRPPDLPALALLDAIRAGFATSRDGYAVAVSAALTYVPRGAQLGIMRRILNFLAAEGWRLERIDSPTPARPILDPTDDGSPPATGPHRRVVLYPETA